MISSSFASGTKANKTLALSAIALSLFLAGCSGAAEKAHDQAPPAETPISSTPSTASFTKVDAGEFFNNDSQHRIEVNHDKEEFVLPTGIVSEAQPDGKNSVVKFTPFEESAKGWEFEVPESNGTGSGVMTTYIRWEGKTYVVADILVTTTAKGTGLDKDVKKSVENSYIIDAETGDKVNVISANVSSFGSESEYNHVAFKSAHGESKTIYTDGLIFAKINVGTRVINPLTGAVVSEKSVDQPLGYDKNEYAVGFASFGNYEVRAKTDVIRDNKVLVLNRATGTKYEVPCGVSLPSTSDVPVSVSPDFRYFNVAGTFTYDTKTNTGFCTAETEKKAAIKVLGISNEGTAYGVVANDDTPIVEVPFGKIDEAKVTPSGKDKPGIITATGSGVFSPDKNSYIVVSKK